MIRHLFWRGGDENWEVGGRERSRTTPGLGPEPLGRGGCHLLTRGRRAGRDVGGRDTMEPKQNTRAASEGGEAEMFVGC